MRADTLHILRCPFCGGRLSVVDSLPHRRDGDDIVEATLGCHCCVFPVVAGIPVLHLEPEAKRAQDQMKAGDAAAAKRTLLGVDGERSERFETAAGTAGATYRELVEALGPGFEGGYFLYRFSDPTFLVADAVVRAVAAAVPPRTHRSLDLCGGSGHLTRSLIGSPAAPILADLHFSKLWLARRFTAPGCEAVCCDANAPLPFEDAAFDLAVCSDAFHYVWTKRLFASEMMRLAGRAGAIAVTHAHNALQWNPSAGMPLPPDAYADLFAPMSPRLFAEARLLHDVVETGMVDLSRRDDPAALEADPALTIVASLHDEVFRRQPPDRIPGRVRGDLRINPLYAARSEGGGLALRLAFPSPDYEDEYGACRDYLPADAAVDRAVLDALADGRVTPEVEALIRRRVILDVPKGYF